MRIANRKQGVGKAKGPDQRITLLHWLRVQFVKVQEFSVQCTSRVAVLQINHNGLRCVAVIILNRS